MIDRRNRALWILISLLLLAVGAGGLLVGYGVFGDQRAASPLLPAQVAQPVEDLSRVVVLAAVVVIGLLLTVLGWRLARAQLRRGGGRTDLGDLELQPIVHEGMRPTGQTVVRGPAIAKTMEHDLQRVRGVKRALVGLYGSSRELELRTQIDVDDTADLGRVRAGVRECLDRLTTTTGLHPKSLDVTFRVVSGEETARVA
jgi:multisubunit Na+/H+ antiporter MnhC subunit